MTLASPHFDVPAVNLFKRSEPSCEVPGLGLLERRAVKCLPHPIPSSVKDIPRSTVNHEEPVRVSR